MAVRLNHVGVLIENPKIMNEIARSVNFMILRDFGLLGGTRLMGCE